MHGTDSKPISPTFEAVLNSCGASHFSLKDVLLLRLVNRTALHIVNGSLTEIADRLRVEMTELRLQNTITLLFLSRWKLSLSAIDPLRHLESFQGKDTTQILRFLWSASYAELFSLFFLPNLSTSDTPFLFCSIEKMGSVLLQRKKPSSDDLEKVSIFLGENYSGDECAAKRIELRKMCIQTKQYQILEFLVETESYKGSVNDRTESGVTKLDRSLMMGCFDEAEEELAKGANINYQIRIDSVYYKKQETPLHWAARIGRMDIVQFLVRCGADLELLDAEDKTPLMLAKENQREEIIKHLNHISNEQQKLNEEAVTIRQLVSQILHKEKSEELEIERDLKSKAEWASLAATIVPQVEEEELFQFDDL